MTLRPEVVTALQPVGGAVMTTATSENEAIAALEGADAVIVSDNAYTMRLADALKASPTLKWMQIMTAGYDNATRLGAPSKAVITSVGDAFSPSVAVHAVALMLALQRGLHRMIAAQATSHWDRSLTNFVNMPDGMTALVLGYGSIGREFAKMVQPIGMKVIGLTRSGGSDALAEIHKIDALHRLLPSADVLLVAAPSRPDTDKIVGARELALMKPSAFLVNISRGKLVDTAALNEALRAGKIAGAGLDVTEPEPLPADNPLWQAPNVIICPHVAGAAGPYGAQRQIERVADNLRRYLAGQPVENRVVP